MRTGDKMKENKENKEEQAECWICKRGFTEALDEFNKRVLSSKYLDEDVKSRYEKGKKEFFPFTMPYSVSWIKISAPVSSVIISNT